MEDKRGRPARYLTIEKFERFLNNDFFHTKVELRVNTIINALLLGGMITLLCVFLQ